MAGIADDSADRYLATALEQVRGRLLDTTRRNRLLNYKESGRDIAIIDEMPDQVFDHLVVNGKSFTLDPYEIADEEQIRLPDGSDQEPPRTLPASASTAEVVAGRYRDGRLQTPLGEKDLDRRLRRLYSTHRTIIEETGANNLYLAMGFLEWRERGDDSLDQRAPLVLVPVRIEREGRAGAARYSIVFDDEALDTNYSLVEKLRQTFDIGVPTVDEEQSPETYWRQVDVAIDPRKKDGWRIVREMAIGLFRFQKQVMWHDLDPARWPSHSPLVDKSLVRRILLGPRGGEAQTGQITDEYFQDELGEAEATYLALIRDADSSQYSALVDAVTREDGLVIEGPPGTGKSQTITNLIGAALLRGKAVLFVAEKMAALEVVYKRLEEADLGDFCLQLHGLKTAKRDLLDSVHKRMDRRPSRPRSIARQREQLAASRKELIEVSRALSQAIGPEQLPLYEVPWHVEQLRQALPTGTAAVPIESPEELSIDAFEQARRLLGDLGREWASIPAGAREAWQGFRPTTYRDSQQEQLIAVLDRGLQAARRLQTWIGSSPLSEGVPQLDSISRLQGLAAATLSDHLLAPPFGTTFDLPFHIVHGDLLQSFGTLLRMLDQYLETVSSVNQVFDYASPEAKLRAAELEEHATRLANVACNEETTVGDLPIEHSSFGALIHQLQSLAEHATPVLNLTGGFARTLEDYESLAERARQLSDGPEDLFFHATPLHAATEARAQLARAREQFATLSELGAGLDSFHLERAAHTSEIRAAANQIAHKQHSWFPSLGSDYRAAKRLIRSLLRRKNEYSRGFGFLRKLESLASFCERRDQFRADSELQRALGSKFEGIETDWNALSELIDLATSLRDNIGLQKAQELLADWSAHADQMEACASSLSRITQAARDFAGSHPFPPAMWERPVVEVAQTLSPWMDRIQASAETISQPWCASGASLRQCIDTIASYRSAKEQGRAVQQFPEFERLLSEHWRGPDTPIRDLRAVGDWLQTWLDQPGIDVPLLQKLLPSRVVLETELFTKLVGEATALVESTDLQILDLQKCGTVDSASWLGGADATLSTYVAKLSACRDSISSVPLMLRWQQLRSEVRELGLDEIAEAVVLGQLRGEECVQAFEYSVYSRILETHINMSPSLSAFSHERYEGARARFADYDRDVLKTNAREIAYQLTRAKVPEGIGYGPVRNYSERRLLVHEHGKTRRHIPLRQLIRRSGNALQALKPCFLMSPLSVAQFLAPGDIEFDLVVMDEASQIRPEDALGAMARARTAIIVGDPKQLPPTSFFDTTVGEDEEAEETIVDDTESILDVCLKQLPYRRLRWHYRSQHEDLIRFSNQQFYDNDLIVFPSPRGDSRDFGVHFNFIRDSSYRSGRNTAEAKVVVANVARHFRAHPKRSLGVAAFNKRQAEEIELLLERARQEDPALDEAIAESSPSLFVKNLESVQGDERDVIFISTTYGPESGEGGRVFQRFGPINSDMGWRRLNVIATRARQRVEVFSSMRGSDVLVGEKTRRGVRALRSYLEYAETGWVLDHGRVTQRAPESEFEEAVGEIVRNLGYEVEPQVGVDRFFIDLGVRHPDRPGEFLMGIECDGAAYHSARSIRDRDRLRQSILEDKGWFIHRIWSTSWFHTRGAEIDRLSRALKDRLAESRRITGPSAYVAEEEAAAAVVADTDSLDDRDDASLSNALDRFWRQNIESQFPERSQSILSDPMVRLLVECRPETEDQWYRAIPIGFRQKMDPKQRGFLADILDLIAEYS